MTDAAQVRRLVDAAVGRFGRIDVMLDDGLHRWTEPMERVLVAAAAQAVRVAAARPGDMVEPAVLAPIVRWWPTAPRERVAEAPVWSSPVEPFLPRR